MHTVTLRDRTFDGKQAPEWATAVARFNNHWYWEESLGQANGTRFQLIGGARARTYNNNRIKGYDASYLLPPLQDDLLPPVPDSVRYYTVPSKTQYLDILHNKFGEVEIRSILPDFASYNYLTPDSALQLAHDLRRMAMQIKRNQKKEQAQ